jgi:hypothetical protein
MTSDEDKPYIDDAEREKYREFVRNHLPPFARNSSGEMWHYTSGHGLVSIISTGQLYSTQVSCLNDTLEQRYFGDLIHAAVKKDAITNTNPNLAALYEAVDSALSSRDFSAAFHFVTCFSEVEDDLGQWRGYGGGPVAWDRTIFL